MENEVIQNDSERTSSMLSGPDRGYEDKSFPGEGQNYSRYKLLGYQFLIFALTFLNYGVLHATRSVWSAATKEFIDAYDGQISENDVAGLNTTFLTVYSLGVFFTGQLADKYRKRWLIAIIYGLVALAMVSIACLSFIPVDAQHKALPAYYTVKAVNGLLQSPCWAINLVLMSNWFPRTGRGILLGVWGCNTSIGNIIGAQAFKLFGSVDDLATPFFAVAVIVGAAGLLSLILIVELPSDVGIPIEIDGKNENEPIEERRKINFWESFTVPGIIEFSLCFFFAKLVQNAMSYWVITYLQDEMDYDKDAAIDIFSWYETGALVGNITLGLMSDLMPVRSPVYLLATLASAVLVSALGWQNPIDDGGSQFWLTANLFALGAVLSGKTLVVAAIECDLGNWVRRTRNLDSLGTFTGIIDGFASIGGILSQSVVIAAKNKWGWSGAYDLMGILLAVSLLPAARFLYFELRIFREKKQTHPFNR